MGKESRDQQDPFATNQQCTTRAHIEQLALTTSKLHLYNMEPFPCYMSNKHVLTHQVQTHTCFP